MKGVVMRMISRAVGLALILVLAGCGGESTPDPGTKTDPGTTTMPGGGNNGGGATCTFQAPAVGKRVLFGGTQGAGTAFPDANKDYIGTVKTVFTNGVIEVEWPDLGTSNVQQVSVLRPEGSCNPDLNGKRVVWMGAKGPGTLFPNPNADYFGKWAGVFAHPNGLAEIDWDHLTENTVEGFADIAIAQ